MARYFCISNGLRGCYMPEFVYVAKCETRRELKSALAYEADSLRSAGYFGLSRRNVAALSAWCWRNSGRGKTWRLDQVIPCSLERGGADYGLFVSHATRAEYQADQSESGQ